MDRLPKRDIPLRRPSVSEEETKPGRLTQIASWSIGCAGAVILSFVAFFLTLGASGPLMVLVAIIFGVCFLHYLVWGRWLSKILKEEAGQEDADVEETIESKYRSNGGPPRES